MIKFRITPQRFAESCNVMEYITMTGGNLSVAVRVLPRFIVDENNEYIVKVNVDEEGDIKNYENQDAALASLVSITPKRLEQLAKQLTEAAKDIVNPPKEGG